MRWLDWDKDREFEEIDKTRLRKILVFKEDNDKAREMFVKKEDSCEKV